MHLEEVRDDLALEDAGDSPPSRQLRILPRTGMMRLKLRIARLSLTGAHGGIALDDIQLALG